MADQEIAKHSKQMWGIMNGGEHGVWHKAREMLLEIFIIVFAVSISIWFHSMAEHRHEQAKVKSFLLGLKRDIQADNIQIAEVLAFHHASDERYAYLATRDPNEPPVRDKFNAAYSLLNSNNFLVPRLARYEGFKSSGKLINVEDEALLEKIVSHYEYAIPKASLSSSGWMGNHRALQAYLEEKTSEDDSLKSRYQAIASLKGKRLAERMVTFHQLYERHEGLLKAGKEIIADIDRMYP